MQPKVLRGYTDRPDRGATRSFGDCLEAIVGRCCQSFDLHLDDLFAIIDVDRIFREFGERLSEWRRLSQSEAQSHYSAPFPDIRSLVEGPHVYTLLQADAHHRQIARSLAGPSMLSNRGPKGEPKERKTPRRRPRRAPRSGARKLRPARRRRRWPRCSTPAVAATSPPRWCGREGLKPANSCPSMAHASPGLRSTSSGSRLTRP